MQTKSPLARFAVTVGVALLVLSLFLFAKIHMSAHSSQNLSANSTSAEVKPAAKLSPAQRQDMAKAYGNLPLAFEANQGQTASDVRFLSHGRGYQVFLTSNEAVLTLRQAPMVSANKAQDAVLFPGRRASHRAEKASVLRIQFAGANPSPAIAGTNPLPGKVNYFIGNDPKKWHTHVPSFQAVKYQEVYPGVDLLFYGRQQHLEYDFVVAPGADPNAIALNVSGARKLEINSQGDLVMSAPGGKVSLLKPVVYQDINGERRQIAGNYALAKDHQIHFSVADYDHSQPLTIDPILNYSTYVGGTTSDTAFAMALDAAGNAYIAGQTFSTDFPQMNAEPSTPPVDIATLGTAFISVLNPAGSALTYSTYLGGSGGTNGGDLAEAIAVDTASPVNIYVAGQTFSPDFPPTTNAFIGAPGPAGTSTGGSAFVTKLVPAASGTAQLAYSSYLGGDTSDDGHGIAVDATGNIYVDGVTLSTNFPTVNPLFAQTSASGNAFLSEINPSALTGPTSLVFSTYLGGTGTGAPAFSFPFAEDATGIAFSGSNAYLVGTTTSTNFPVHGTQIKPCLATGSVFISEINTVTPALTYSTCVGGTTGDFGNAIALGPTNLAYLTGNTFSANFPVVPAGNTIPVPPPATSPNATGAVAFVSVVNTTTGALTYSTLLGGNNGDVGEAIAVDSAGNAYVTGLASSTDFPITQGAFQTTLVNSSGGAFVTEINPAGANAQAQLLYSSFLNGSKGVGTNLPTADIGLGIALGSGNVFLDGQAGTSDFPTTSAAFQTGFKASAGNSNAFVTDMTLTPTISVSPTSLDFGTQLVSTPSQPQFVTLTNNTASAVTLTLPPTTTGTNQADFAGTASGILPCTTSLAAGSTCTVGVIFTPATTAAESATLGIVDSLDGAGHPIQVALTGIGSATASNITLTPTTLTLPGALLTTTSGPLPVTIGNNGNLPLSISAISAGTGAFSEANTCGGFPIVIAPGGTCMVNVSFTPPANTPPGPVSDSLTVTQTGGNSASVPLSGTAWDFTLTVPSSATVSAAAPAMIPIGVNGLGGFTGTVALACSSASPIASCTITTPGTVGANATATVTATGMTAMVVNPEPTKPPVAPLPQVIFAMLAIAMLFMLPVTKRFRTRLGMVAAMLVFVVLAGCSGHPHSGQSTTLTITGTAGTMKTYTINLTVQ